MQQNLNDFYNYGDSSRLILLLIDFASSIFVAWIISMPLNWIRGLIICKVDSRNEIEIKNLNNLNYDPDLRITKLDKPINEMDAAEPKIAAEKISEIMLEQARKYKKKE